MIGLLVIVIVVAAAFVIMEMHDIFRVMVRLAGMADKVRIGTDSMAADLEYVVNKMREEDEERAERDRRREELNIKV